MGALQPTLKRLLDQYAFPDAYDRAGFYPTMRALKLLIATEDLLGDLPIPSAAVAVTTEGGLSLYWRQARGHYARFLHLALPGDMQKQTYLYHDEVVRWDVVRDVTPELLSEWLRWLVK